jgi:hypothetical protein
MYTLSAATTSSLSPCKAYLHQRRGLVDWLSGVGESLRISNQAIHHAVCIVDLFATREKKNFDIWLASLVALLVSAKFVQMKYPSADSLNSATGNAYTYDAIIKMEGYLLTIINWELLQYPVFEFLNFFLA